MVSIILVCIMHYLKDLKNNNILAIFYSSFSYVLPNLKM